MWTPISNPSCPISHRKWSDLAFFPILFRFCLPNLERPEPGLNKAALNSILQSTRPSISCLLKGSGLDFGCELLSDNPEAAAGAAEDAAPGSFQPVVVLPEDATGGPDASPAQVIVPAGAFGLEQAIMLRRVQETGFAVLTKLVEQGPGFEIYEFVSVG